MEGLYPSVRSLTWPDSVSPLDLSGFETQARRLRYQALGDECRKQGIQCLLLAHHDDDQAETVLMRLASGHKGLGLQGMRSSTDIPECWGMHGVHRSGTRDLAALRLRREEEVEPPSPKAKHLRRILASHDIFEEGGVKILRPLLGFSKERLIETCRARALPWEEDKTNKETWRTTRNNVRELLRSAKLPQALQKTSMLQLAKQTSENFQKTKGTVEKLASCCEILLFDARCGGLIVRLPRRLMRLCRDLGREEAGTVDTRKVLFTATLLLRDLVQIVTPVEEVSLQSLRNAAVSIFTELNNGDTTADRRLQPTTFTGGGVQFQRLHSPLPAPRSEFGSATSGPWQDLDPVFVWKLTRQPFSKAPLILTVQPSANTESSTADNPPFWSPWQLWDGRYWIRLFNRSCQPLIVRSFQVSDLKHLRSTLNPQRYEKFYKFLRLAAPDKVRWTLLAIAEPEDDTLTLGRVLALPTLGKAGIFDIGDGSGTSKVEWQVRYKYVGFEHQNSGEAFSKISRNPNLISSWKN